MGDPHQESLYFVFCPSNGIPTKRHPTIEEATAEAKRLASLTENQGREFIVCRAIQSITYRTDPFVCKQYCKK